MSLGESCCRLIESWLDGVNVITLLLSCSVSYLIVRNKQKREKNYCYEYSPLGQFIEHRENGYNLHTQNDSENKIGTENSSSFSSHVYCVYDLTCYPFHCYRANLGPPFLIRKMIKCDNDGDLLFYICFYIYN